MTLPYDVNIVHVLLGERERERGKEREREREGKREGREKVWHKGGARVRWSLSSSESK